MQAPPVPAARGGRDLFDQVGDRLVAVEVLALQARVVLRAEVVRRVVLGTLGGAGQEAAAERAERHEADPQFAQDGQHVRLEVAFPDRILALQRRHGLHGVGAADRRGARLGQPEVQHLAFADQVFHRTRHILDRHVRVDAVLVQQVDAVRAQAGQGGLDHLADVRRAAVGAGEMALADDETELRRDLHLVAPAFQRAAQQFLVREGTIHFGRVEQGAAQVDGAVDRRDGFGVVGRAVSVAHAHAAQPDGGDLQSLGSQLSSRQHVVILFLENAAGGGLETM
jgi:hypothetical protein